MKGARLIFDLFPGFRKPARIPMLRTRHLPISQTKRFGEKTSDLTFSPVRVYPAVILIGDAYKNPIPYALSTVLRIFPLVFKGSLFHRAFGDFSGGFIVMHRICVADDNINHDKPPCIYIRPCKTDL